MKVNDAYIVWREAKAISDKIKLLKKQLVSLDVEPELVTGLVEANVKVSRVIAHIRNYDVIEDDTARARRRDWGDDPFHPSVG